MFKAVKSRFYSGKRNILISMILITAFVLASCMGALTEISGTWTKPGFSGKKFKNILVVAITNDVIKRNTVETAVVNELGKEKIKASTSSAILDLSKIDKGPDGKIDTTKLDEVKKNLLSAGYDAGIVISLLDIKEKTEYVPGQTYYQPNYYTAYRPYGYNGFYNYSYTTYSVVNTPGYYVEKKNIFIESRLFDLTDDDMKWAAQSETLNPKSIGDFSKSYATALINSLLSDYVIK
jgi:hypothetical protein